MGLNNYSCLLESDLNHKYCVFSTILLLAKKMFLRNKIKKFPSRMGMDTPEDLETLRLLENF